MPTVDQNGVHCVYASGKQGTSYEEDFRSSSHRWDVMNLGANNYVSIEFHVYVAWSNPSGDEWGVQLGGGKHSDNSNPKCYVFGIDNKSGATRLRGEDSHPDYFSIGNGSSGVGLSSKYLGGSFVKRAVSGGVLCEIWMDAGNNESSPANSWKRLLSIVEKDKNWRQPPSDHCIVFRMDEGDLDSIKIKWFLYREILDSDPTTAFGGTGSGTPPSGGGGTGGGSTGGGSGGGGGCGCGGGGSSGGGGGDDNSGGDTGGETGGEPEPPPDPEEPDPVVPEILTVQKVFSYRWNVITPPESCNQAEPTISRELNMWYETPSTEFDDYWDLYGGNPKQVITRVGLLVAIDKSSLNGQIFRQFIPVVKRVGAPTGDIFLRIYDDKDKLVYTCPNSVIANSLGLNNTEPIFQDFRCETQLKLGYRLVWTYEGGDSANYVRFHFNRTDASDGIKTILTYFVNNKWTNDPNIDLPIKLFV